MKNLNIQFYVYIFFIFFFLFCYFVVVLSNMPQTVFGDRQKTAYKKKEEKINK